jgi:hypothetical protein
VVTGTGTLVGGDVSSAGADNGVVLGMGAADVDVEAVEAGATDVVTGAAGAVATEDDAPELAPPHDVSDASSATIAARRDQRDADVAFPITPTYGTTVRSQRMRADGLMVFVLVTNPRKRSRKLVTGTLRGL